jgi:hypothetical protein
MPTGKNGHRPEKRRSHQEKKRRGRRCITCSPLDSGIMVTDSIYEVTEQVSRGKTGHEAKPGSGHNREEWSPPGENPRAKSGVTGERALQWPMVQGLTRWKLTDSLSHKDSRAALACHSYHKSLGHQKINPWQAREVSSDEMKDFSRQLNTVFAACVDKQGG